MKWRKRKPNFACIFVGRWGNEYQLYHFAWNIGDAPDNASDDLWYYYLAWTTADGDEYDTIEECEADEYLVIKRLPTMNEVHQEEIRREILSLTNKEKQ